MKPAFIKILTYNERNPTRVCSGGFRPSGNWGGEGGGGHPEPEIRRGPGLQKKFLALQASVWSKNKGGKGAESSAPLPWIRHWFG